MAVKSGLSTQTLSYKPKLGLGLFVFCLWSLIDAFILRVPSVKDQGLKRMGRQKNTQEQHHESGQVFFYGIYSS
jgi:hypothetical protein